MSAIERAAAAMHALGNSDPWERQHEYVRQEFRDDARATLSAAIDVDELARVITDAGDRSPDYIACVIYDYLTGDESDE